MKLFALYWLKYLSYFFYLGVNWNFPLAWFIVSREIKGEKKYGLRCTGVDDLRSSVPKSELIHASIYQPLNFYTAEKLFEQLTAEDKKGTFLDIGCGKGRVLAMAAANGFDDIIGIDFSPKLCNEAISNADIIEANYPKATIEIDCIDARYYEIPEEVKVIFLFNPFDEMVMKDFIRKVEKSLKNHPRKIKVLYANPQCKQVFIDAAFTEIYQFQKMVYLHGSVFTN